MLCSLHARHSLFPPPPRRGRAAKSSLWATVLLVRLPLQLHSIPLRPVTLLDFTRHRIPLLSTLLWVLPDRHKCKTSPKFGSDLKLNEVRHNKFVVYRNVEQLFEIEIIIFSQNYWLYFQQTSKSNFEIPLKNTLHDKVMIKLKFWHSFNNDPFKHTT